MSDRWQQLMDQSYDRWQQRDMSRREFLLECTPVERKAVILGNFNGQVNNGGVEQWVDNGYAADTYRDLLVILKQMNTPVALQLREKLDKFSEHVNLCVDGRGFGYDDYWVENWHGEDYENHPTYQAAEELTDWVYSVSDTFLADVEAFIVAQEQQTVTQ